MIDVCFIFVFISTVTLLTSINCRIDFLYIAELVATSPRMMNNRGRTYERLLAQTLQPNTVPTLVTLVE